MYSYRVPGTVIQGQNFLTVSVHSHVTIPGDHVTKFYNHVSVHSHVTIPGDHVTIYCKRVTI